MTLRRFVLFAAVGCLGVIAVAFGTRSTGWVTAFLPWIWKGEDQIDRATKSLASFQEQDWQALYADAMGSYANLRPSNQALPSSNWPKSIGHIHPSWVWVNNDGFEIQWTGGFDDFSLYMYVNKPTGGLNNALQPEGIRILDTRGILAEFPCRDFQTAGTKGQ